MDSNKWVKLINTYIILDGPETCKRCRALADVQVVLFKRLIGDDNELQPVESGSHLFCFDCLNKWKADYRERRLEANKEKEGVTEENDHVS